MIKEAHAHSNKENHICVVCGKELKPHEWHLQECERLVPLLCQHLLQDLNPSTYSPLVENIFFAEFPDKIPFLPLNYSPIHGDQHHQ